MLQPTASAWIVVLLVMTAAEAQPQSLHGRSVTLSGDPAEPLPEVRVAARIPLILLFDAPIDKASLQLDATRLQLADAGERSLIIVPVVSPSEKEPWVLRVRYADAGRPEWAAFALVSRPPEVDGRIDVVRRPQPLEACQAALAEARAQAGSPRAPAEPSPSTPTPTGLAPAAAPAPEPAPALALPPTSAQEKGPTVKARSAPSAAVPSPCAQQQAPPRGAAAWRAWCQCASLVGTLVALQAGCAGPQVRPASEPCPPEIRDIMAELKIDTHMQIGIFFVPDVPKEADRVLVKEGPITSVVEEGAGQLKEGSLLFGEMKIVEPWKPEPLPGGAVGTARYTLAQLPDGKKYPVCIDAVVQGGPKPGAIESAQPGAGRIRLKWFRAW